MVICNCQWDNRMAVWSVEGKPRAYITHSYSCIYHCLWKQWIKGKTMLFNLKNASQRLLTINIGKSPKKGISDSYLKKTMLEKSFWYIPERPRRRKILHHAKKKSPSFFMESSPRVQTCRCWIRKEEGPLDASLSPPKC